METDAEAAQAARRESDEELALTTFEWLGTNFEIYWGLATVKEYATKLLARTKEGAASTAQE